MKPARSAGRRTPSAPKQPSRLSIGLFNSTGATARLLRRAARKTLLLHGVRRGRLDITLVGNRQMSQLHGRWKKVRRTTDVLTFDLRERPIRGLVDGEVIVCTDVAKARARQRGTAASAELALYVVHGCLHLVGFDDAARGQADRMHRREDEILESLGLGKVYSGPADRE